MKKLIVFLTAVMVLWGGVAFADVYVKPYYRSNGTYVQGHYRSSPNSTTYDNWSTKGNVNPYTGQKGYRNPIPQYPSAPSYRSGSSFGQYGTLGSSNYGLGDTSGYGF